MELNFLFFVSVVPAIILYGIAKSGLGGSISLISDQFHLKIKLWFSAQNQWYYFENIIVTFRTDTGSIWRCYKGNSRVTL